MLTAIVLLLIVICVLLNAMVAGYSTLSTSHLRHWARQKDAAALKLYPLKARGSAALLTLELLRALAVSGLIVAISAHADIWLAWLIVALLFFVAFIVLTQLYLKPFGIRLLVWCGPLLLAMTNFLKPIMLPLGRVFDRFLDEEPVTLTRSQLIGMLEAVSPEDTDLTPGELRISRSLLDFYKKTVHDTMVPASKLTTIVADEILTPVILDELHKTGHERFPVMAPDNKSVIGVLYMHDLMDIKRHDRTAESMMRRVYFVEEDSTLEHVLQVFYKTKQSVYVVHNAASDMVGMITLEGIVQEIFGKPAAKKPIATTTA